MKSVLGFGLGVITVASVLAFGGCGDDGNPTAGGAAAGGAGHAGMSAASGGAAEGNLECQVIGELCHEADSGSGPAHDCHEVGHEGDGAACASEFVSCIGTCVLDQGAGGSGQGSEQDTRCAALGELCHPVDDLNGPLHDCHEVGHDGDAQQCAAAFDDCATRCLAARALAEAGEGGAGGMPASAGASAAGGAPAGVGGAGAGP